MVFKYIEYYGGTMRDPRQSAMGSSFLLNYVGYTDAQKEAFNDAGGMVLIGLPRSKSDAFYEAQSPILCCVQRVYLICEAYPSEVVNYGCHDPRSGGSVYAYINREYVGSDKLRVYNTGGEYYTIAADAYKGEAVLDVSSLVRQFMGDRLFYFDEGEPMFDVNALGAAFTIYHDSDPDINAETIAEGDIYAINGVDTLGNENYGHQGEDVILTKQRELILWDVYEHSTPNTNVGAPKVAYYDFGSYEVVIDIIKSQADFNQLVQMFPNAGFTFKQVSIKDCKPVQVMWINDNGGIEQAIFLYNQIERGNVKTSGVSAVYNGIGRYAPYQIDIDAAIVLGVENVNNSEYERLVTLAKSWYVALYDRDYIRYGYWGSPIVIPRYIRTYVKEFKGDYQRGRLAQNFEVSLNLPANYNTLVKQ